MTTDAAELLAYHEQTKHSVASVYGRPHHLDWDIMPRPFKVYPSLFGYTINDDAAELTFRLFDHPRVWVLQRTTPR